MRARHLHTVGCGLALLVAGCLDVLAPDVGPLNMDPSTCNQDDDPAVAVSFVGDVAPIFRRVCDRCHLPGGEGERDSGLDLSTYTSLLAGGRRSVDTIVVPGKPCDSILRQKIGPAPPFGARMPRGSNPLSATEIALIHDWIAEGALDN